MHQADYADRAVALANTALPDLTAARRLLRDQVSEWYARRATAADLGVLEEVRGELRRVFADAAGGRGRAAVDRLNRLLTAWPVTPRISGHDDERWHLHVTGPKAPDAAAEYVTSACYGLALALTEHGVDHLGVCADTSCGNAFLERNGGRPRRWCSDRCATRAHVAAYRARQKAAR